MNTFLENKHAGIFSVTVPTELRLEQKSLTNCSYPSHFWDQVWHGLKQMSGQDVIQMAHQAQHLAHKGVVFRLYFLQIQVAQN